MLNDTWLQYLLIRGIIVFLQYLGPACFGYTVYNIANAWPEWLIQLPEQAHIFSFAQCAFQIWCLAESAFLLFFLPYRHHLQRAALHPTLRSRAERRALFNKVRSEVHDLERFLSGWFRGAKIEDIGREDLKIFLDWAFWEGRADVGPGGRDEEEAEEYTAKMEVLMPTPFKAGWGTAKCLRLTLDPIEIECRTLLWYSLMMLADTVTHIWMRSIGFRYFKTAKTSLRVFPPRPTAIAETAHSPAKAISYWTRPHTSRTRLPILYVHGIGIGLLPQVPFLNELDRALNSDEKRDGDVGILAIEILQVSMRLTDPILGRGEFIRQLTEVLNFHNYDRFILTSHSYGSVLSTHILYSALSSRISATLLIDPVSLLLHMPDVAYNFTVRRPKKANEWQLWYFASKDPGVAHTLGRHFFWSENVLWRDRIMQLVEEQEMKFTASLASRDLIVDTEAVGMYLAEHQVPDPVVKEDAQGRKEMALQTPAQGRSYGTAELWKQRPWKGQGLEVLWWDGLDHAQVFDSAEGRGRLVGVLVEYSKGT